MVFGLLIGLIFRYGRASCTVFVVLHIFHACVWEKCVVLFPSLHLFWRHITQIANKLIQLVNNNSGMSGKQLSCWSIVMWKMFIFGQVGRLLFWWCLLIIGWKNYLWLTHLLRLLRGLLSRKTCFAHFCQGVSILNKVHCLNLIWGLIYWKPAIFSAQCLKVVVGSICEHVLSLSLSQMHNFF